MSRSTAHPHQHLWNKWIKEGDGQAGDQLVEKYMPLVHYHVQRIQFHLPKSVIREDLISHGLNGLYDAMKKFDFSRDLKFDTYASFRIRGAIIDGLRQEDWMPRSLREKAKKIEETTEELEQEYGRHVREEEVGRVLGMSKEEVRKVTAESFFAHTLSMDEATPEGEREETFTASIADKNVLSPEETYIKSAALQELADVIQHLPEKEKVVIGLFYQEEMTLTEIGEIMSLSTSRISQIHSKALFRLKQTLKNRWNT
ncbi:RNA polymerase, sigma 28 subunit, SigD/FliA/WhiG [Alteribacillus persepolensis]|uniref:RNA polymerase, sigma 28 subunit, SigD/FliA/WhiG n=1 Tax=Alteribacillus persepolensis TaxID=568899 RepID=A0A1G7YQH9_9BACI|nr:FliA/WhiG family RNA polymerase sigma factor [Alteribacillus persepolensis]SDG98667.1 RNA polymerase, sigma 28 subunit, SigD/FliA/WhiG [Alteribacillus persepolensis]